jgi:hypothetical protein
MTDKKPDWEDKIREIIGQSICDGQNQIYDLHAGEATGAEVNERMFKAVDYHSEKIRTLLAQKEQEAAKHERDLMRAEIERLRSIRSIPEEVDGYDYGLVLMQKFLDT